jgi:CRP-like cAMP-binding protein
VARYLLAEARRQAQPVSGRVSIALTQTNQQIAARVGSVREVVSRAFSRLQHDRLIILEDRTVIIPDLEALSSFADEQTH